MRPLKRIPWLAAGAMLLALAPLPASAHSGHDHGVASAPQAGGGADYSKPIGVAPAHGWSRSCPASPGSACCCGGLTVCPGGARIALVNAGGWVVFLAQPARGFAEVRPAAEPLSQSPRLPSLPRAPPFFS